MMHYINIDKKRLCGRNNNQVSPILFDAATEEPLQLQFITSNNQIVHLNPDELSGLYLAGNTKAAEPAYDLLFLSKDYTIENDVLTFAYSTYTKNFLRKITKRNQEILIEIGQIALEKKTLLLRDYALANPRVYIEGSAPEDVDWSDYYTKEETQELLAQNLSSAQAYADGQDAATLASATAYTDEKIAEIDLSEYVTDEELEAAKAELEGDIALKADESDLQLVSGEVDSLAQDISGKAEQSVVDTISGDLDTHEADTTIHVTAANKTAWNAKAEVSDIPTDNAQLTNGAGYQTAQDVQNAISGKAETSYVDTELAKKQDKITAENKLDYALLSGEPDLSIYATEADLQVVSGVVDTKLEAPSGGTSGQVLTKTADGAEWADAQGGGVDNTDYLTLMATQANSTIALNKNTDNPSLSAVLEYSTDGETWTNYTWDGTSGLVITLANVGDYVMLRGDNATFSINVYNFYRFVMTGKVDASGNIMSLLDKSCKQLKLTSNYVFYSLFYSCSALYSVPKLPATALTKGCYTSMFNYCTSLTSVPTLPATSLAVECYMNMFEHCSNISNASIVLATVYAPANAYSGMFRFCSKLVSGPKILAKSFDLWALSYMFQGDPLLTSIDTSFMNWDDNHAATKDWLDGVSALGTFYCPYGLDTSIRDVSHIPAGWNVVYTDVPESVLSGVAAAAEALTMING